MPQPSEREIEIFNAALELTAAERGAYLDGVCAGDAALRQRVEEILRANEAAGAFLESPAAVPPKPGGTVRLSLSPAEKPGDRIGRYKLLQQIGEGGCGVVYMAEQEEPVRRKVALKVIKLGMDTRSVIARFEAERQALALMDHPNIAKVFDAGATETGRPYFVMELVRGTRITEFCDQNQLSTRERLNLFVLVCQAIQHAHQKGVIHRDIKPSNVLVTLNDGVPMPKVIDFGIAKAIEQSLTEKTLFTAFEQFLGTPAYMSPEQAEMNASGVDTRSDIYSLGILLYELLTGTTPFDAKELMKVGLEEIRRIIREKEPARPSTRLTTMTASDLTAVAELRQAEPAKLSRLIRGELDWIVMKALEKDRARRYETAYGLAADIQRHLSNEPVVACPPSNLYRFQKLVRRNKVLFIAASLVIAALTLGLGIATMALVRIQRDDQQIREVKDDALEKLRTSYLAEARAIRTSGRTGQRFASLEALQNAAAIRADMAVRNEAIACLAVSDLRVSKQVVLKGPETSDLTCFDLEVEKYAVGEANGNISVRALTNDQEFSVLVAPGFSLRSIRGFSPNSRYLEARYWRKPEGYSDWIWDVEQQKPILKELPGYWAEDFSSDSRFLSRCHPDGTLSIYDLTSGQEFKRMSGTRQFHHLILNSENTKLACSSEVDSKVEIRDVESGRITLTLACPTGVSALAWSPDGKRLATAGMDFRIYVWTVEDRQLRATLEGHSSYIMEVAFNHEGNLLASASFDNLTRLWNPDSGRQIANHPGNSWQFQFSPDDQHLLGGREMTQGDILEVAYSRECRSLYVPRVGGRSIHSGPEFSADGRILCAGNDDRVRFWDAYSGKEIGSFFLPECDRQIFHPDGHSMIFIDRQGGVSQRSLARISGPTSSTYRLGKPRPFYGAQKVYAIALSQDGRHLAATCQAEGESLIFDLQDPSAKPVVLRPHPAVDRIAISPDSRWAATSSWFNSLVRVWDARTGDLVRTLSMPARSTVAFSPDGRWLATSSTKYQLWEVGSWQPKGPPIPGHSVAQWNFTAFSPDGRMIARTVEGAKIQLLETFSEKTLATLESSGSSALASLQFSPDGSHLAALQQDQQVQLWDLRLIRAGLEKMHLDWDMPPIPQVEKMATQVPATLEVEAD